MTTFSIGLTGASANQKFAQKELTVPDDVVAATGVTLTVATVSGMANCMQLNQPFLAKGPSGALNWYTYDAERSTPALPILRRV